MARLNARPQSGGIGVQLEGMDETLRALDGLERDLARPAANKRLRAAAGDVARPLAAALASAAGSSGVPVAPRVASSISVTVDGGVPAVAIGGSKMVGTGKRGFAAVLVWGSERGPASDPNRFAVAPNSSGYWIRPTVQRFKAGPALDAYRRAVDHVVHDAGLEG